jgi:hypothetical protein
MMVNGEKRAVVRRMIEQSGLPSAPLMMPDQVLVREKKSFRLRPLIHWLAVR